MRRRRAARLVLRADIAAEAGYPEDARTWLEEARRLAPSLPELDQVEKRLSPVISSFRRRIWQLLPAAAALLLLTMTATPLGVNAPVGPSRAPADPSVVAIDNPSVVAIRLERVSPTAGLAVRPIQPKPLAEPADRPAPAVRVASPAAIAALPEIEPSPAPVAALAEPAAAVAPLSVAVLAPPTPPAAEEPSQEPLVRSTLNRYAAAYSALDADAAQRVWPGVDRAALSRAFETLSSQEISLADCRINVAAHTARATCAGSASWTPRVGSGSRRTDARRWDFELAKAAGAWRIVNARVQNR